MIILGAAIVALVVLVSPLGARDTSKPPHGIYFGWTTAVDMRFQVMGHACPAPDSARQVTAELQGGGRVELELANADLGLPIEAAAMLGAHALNVEGAQSISSLTYFCRSGAEGSVGIGKATLTPVDTTPQQVTLIVRSADPGSILAGRLLVINGGAGPVVLEAIAYAPAEFMTGTLRAASGSREQILAVESAVAPLPAGTERPRPPNQWDAGYLSPSNPRNLRSRSAADLDITLAPGETALLLLDATSLRRTLSARPVVLYPVITLRDVTSGTRLAAGFHEPLAGVTRSWLGRRGG